MLRNGRFVIAVMVMVLTSLVLTACQPPETVAFEDVCDVENDGKNITTQGAFSFGASIYCDDTLGEYRCGLNFNPYPDGGDRFSVEVMVGNRRNMMQDIESGYSDEDLIIKTAGGESIGVGDPVNITGRMLVTENVCVMEVEKIEIPGE
jgi:hypothetical protein